MTIRIITAFLLDTFLLIPIWVVLATYLDRIITYYLVMIRTVYFENNFYIWFSTLIHVFMLYNRYVICIISFLLVYYLINLPFIVFCKSSFGKTITGLRFKRERKVRLIKEVYRVFYFANFTLFILLITGLITAFILRDFSDVTYSLNDYSISFATILIDALFALRKNGSFLHTIKGSYIVAFDLSWKKRIVLILYWLMIFYVFICKFLTVI